MYFKHIHPNSSFRQLWDFDKPRDRTNCLHCFLIIKINKITFFIYLFYFTLKSRWALVWISRIHGNPVCICNPSSPLGVVMHWLENIILYSKILEIMLELAATVNNTPCSHLWLISHCVLHVLNLLGREQCNNQPLLSEIFHVINFHSLS